MTNVKYMDEDVLIKKAMELIINELGPVEAIRFTNLFKGKKMDSVKRHREWQKTLDKTKFFDDVFVD